MPVQHMRVSREEVLHSRKCLAQLVEQLAQVIARLSLGGVGPEEEGKMLALLGNIAMQHEIGEQGAQARGIEVGHLSVTVDKAEITQQSDVKGWHHQNLLTELTQWLSEFRLRQRRLNIGIQPKHVGRIEPVLQCDQTLVRGTKREQLFVL